MTRQLVIIPTYNEIENIRAIILAVLRQPVDFDILVVDDNSPDGTASEVQRMQRDTETGARIHLLRRPGKQGLGTAYLDGFKWALNEGYHFVIEMDADFSHNPDDLPLLWKTCAEEGADVAVGSRYVNGVNVVNWPLPRVLMSYFASVYVRLVTGMSVRDATAGFVCYRSEVLYTMELDKIHFKGYAFQIEMKYTSRLCGFKIKEVPIIFVNRRLGTSKMNSSIFGEAFFGVLQLKWWGLTRKYPQKGSRRIEG